MSKIVVTFVLSLLMALPPARAAAPLLSESVSCQAGKNAAAGTYAACLQLAEQLLALTGESAQFNAVVQLCRTTFTRSWQKLEDRAARNQEICPDETFLPGPSTISSVLDQSSANVALALKGWGIAGCEAAKLDLRPDIVVTCVEGAFDSPDGCVQVKLEDPGTSLRAKTATATCSCVGGPLGGVSGACNWVPIQGGISCHGICTGTCEITIESNL